MLTATFIHAPGVGQTTERSLWQQGAVTWSAFLELSDSLKITPRSRVALTDTVKTSIDRHAARDVRYFARGLPKREHWRGLSSFGDRISYLDIETDGGFDANSVTVIGLYDGFEARTYVRGKDLAEFADDCREFDVFVTFFGGGFDVPFLIRRFPQLESVFADRLHVDLCPLLKRVGHRGGLKSIERQIGIARVEEAEGLDGNDAIRLWRIYRGGGPHAEEALRLLLAYNREDIVNLKTLLEYALPKLELEARGIEPAPMEAAA